MGRVCCADTKAAQSKVSRQSQINLQSNQNNQKEEPKPKQRQGKK